LPRRVDVIVIFPRHTTLVGTTALYSAPMNLRAYSEGFLTGWQGTGLGTTPATVTFTPQKSADLETWFDEDPFSPASANAEVTSEIGITLPWARVKAVVSGADPGVSIWLLGEFVRREGPGAGEGM